MGSCLSSSKDESYHFEAQWNTLDIKVMYPPVKRTIYVRDEEGNSKTVKQVKKELLEQMSIESVEDYVLVAINNHSKKVLSDEDNITDYGGYMNSEGDDGCLEIRLRKKP